MRGKRTAKYQKNEIRDMALALEEQEKTAFDPNNLSWLPEELQNKPICCHLTVSPIRGRLFSDFLLKPVECRDKNALLPENVENIEILSHLYGAWRSNEPSNYVFSTPVRVWGWGSRELLKDLASSNRLFLALDEGEACPIEYDDNETPWTFALQVDRNNSENSYRFEAVLTRKGKTTETVLLKDELATHFTADGWVLRIATLSRFEPADPAWFAMLRKRGWGFTVSAADLLDFYRLIAARWSLPRLLNADQLPAPLVQDAAPVPVLRFDQSANYYTGVLYSARLYFEYGGHAVPVGSDRLLLEKRDHLEHLEAYILRNSAAEERRMDELLALDFNSSATRDIWVINRRHSSRAFADLMQNGWRIEMKSRDGSALQPLQDLNWKIICTSIDWFDLRSISWSDLDREVSADVLEVLDRIWNNDSFIQIDNRGTYLIDDSLRKFLNTAQSVATEQDGALRMPNDLAGMLLAASSDDLEHGLDPESLGARLKEEARQKLASFENIRPLDAHENFTGTLREYQKAGLGWLGFLNRTGLGGCLADDMGLGKTIQVIAGLVAHHAALDGARRAPSLVVMPRSLLGNWLSEFARFAPRLRVQIYHGSERSTLASNLASYDVVLTTYGIVTSDHKRLARLSFEYIVLDEAHQIRNPKTKSFAAVKELRGKHRLALTGTPVINYVRDLRSVFEFLNPGLLHTLPDLSDLLKDAGPAGAEDAGLLRSFLRPFILRRTKMEVLAELPDKTVEILRCDLSGDERKLYDAMRDEYRRQLLRQIDASGMNRARMHVFTAITKLRQLACHPGVLDEQQLMVNGGKLDALLERVEEIYRAGNKTLIFSNFKGFLRVIRAHLEARGYAQNVLVMTGETANRGEIVREFRENPEKSIFLMTTKVGGVGLNLTAANYVFLADPWWNQPIEDQAIDRTHRIGQTRPVFAFRVIAHDTIDEKILLLQEIKRELAGLVIDEQHADRINLTREDVAFLFS